MTTHSFHESLKWSESMTDAPWWEIVYKKAWDDLESMVAVRDDGWAQRAGIDRVITLATGKVIKIDEKVRSQDYDDFFLEFLSSKEHNSPGWVNKPLDADYIAYAFVPSQKCYLLPVQELQRAWRADGERWKYEYGEIGVKNNGYTTVGTPVPRTILAKALLNSMVIDW